MDIETLMKRLGLRLKALRLRNHLKQEDLENYGFSYRYYGKIERGVVNPTLDTLFAFAGFSRLTCRICLFSLMQGN